MNPDFRPVFREKEFFQINYLPKFSDNETMHLEFGTNAGCIFVIIVLKQHSSEINFYITIKR